MLLFKRHFLDLIRAGKKRQTLRLWKSPRVRPGQLAFVPGLGRVKILSITTVPGITRLTRTDANADGFATRKALLQELRRLYHPTPKDRTLYRIRFQWPVKMPRKENSIRNRGKTANMYREQLRQFILEQVPPRISKKARSEC